MKRWIFSVVALCVILASACTPQAKAVFPNGAFTTEEITGSGTATITMTLDNGHFKMASSETGTLTEGSYVLDGDKVTFTEETISGIARNVCGDKTVYSYKWSIDPDTQGLRLEKDNDPCIARAGVANTTWKVAVASK